MANQIVGSDVGTVLVPGHGMISLDQWMEDSIYDTFTISSGAVAAGAETEWFTTLTGKQKDDTNLVENNKLPEGWEIIVMKMGVEILPSADLRDARLISENSYIWFETGNSKTRRIAPFYMWGIGFGIYATHSVASSSASTRKGILQVGGVTFSASHTLLIPIRISPRLNFKATINVATAITLNADLRLRFYLYGYVSRPAQ